MRLFAFIRRLVSTIISRGNAERLEFRELLRLLQRDLADNIRAAEAAGWNVERTERLKVDVRRLFSLTTGLSTRLLILAFVLAWIVIACLFGHNSREPLGLWYKFAGLPFLAIAGCSMWLYWPLVGIFRTLHLLPRDAYRDLVQPVRINLDLLNLAISSAILLYVILPLHISQGCPLVLIATAIWLFAPIALFLAHWDLLFLTVRMGQLALLFAAASFFVISPVPVSQHQWWAQREMANRLRVVHGQEITSQWTNLRWFTPEGAPMVWYSFQKDSGYHLYAEPGHDPETNAELMEVRDSDTRQRILDDLRERRDDEIHALAENRERVTHAAAIKQEEDAKKAKFDEEKSAREAAERLAEESAHEAKAKENARQELIRRYVYPQFVGGSAKTATVLVVLNERGETDRTLGARLSKAFADAGCANVESVFSQAFIASDVFSSINSGYSAEMSFPVADFASRLLVVQPQTTVSQEKGAGTEDLRAATTILKIRLIRADSGRIEYENEVSGRGVGFKETTARSDALERAEAALSKIAPQLRSLK